MNKRLYQQLQPSYWKKWALSATFALGLLASATAQTKLPDHPRLLFPKGSEDALKKKIRSDALAGKIYRETLRRADITLDFPVCRYHIPDGRRLLRESRHALSNVLYCSMAWRLTEKKKYLDRAIRELDAACSFKDWNTNHFLDTAEMSTAVAIGYDWLYHHLSEEQRRRYSKSLREKGLTPARAGFTGKRSWWAVPRNNWSQVCATGLLFAERALEQEGDPIHPGRLAAAKSLDGCRKFYKPDGAYPEGPSYWHYGSNYHTLGLALLATDDVKLSVKTPPEFAKSTLFTEHLTGSTGRVFNFADASSYYSIITAAQCWMAREFNDPATVSIVRARLAEDLGANGNFSTFDVGRFFPLHLLWLPEPPKRKIVRLPTDSQWNGSQSLATFRSSWKDPDALFVAIKGGFPGANHGQMDVGSFVLDSDGVRWVEDLGKDNYNLPGYFGDNRWDYFRLTNLSHSTLVIGGQLQYPKAKPCPITHFESSTKQGSVTFDISSAYHGQVKRVTRTCTLDRKSDSVTITDTIEKPSKDVRWAIATLADIKINGNKVTLTKAGKILEVIRNDKHGGKWSILSATPKTKDEMQNKGVKILAFTTAPSSKLHLSVTFRRP